MGVCFIISMHFLHCSLNIIIDSFKRYRMGVNEILRVCINIREKYLVGSHRNTKSVFFSFLFHFLTLFTITEYSFFFFTSLFLYLLYFFIYLLSVQGSIG